MQSFPKNTSLVQALQNFCTWRKSPIWIPRASARKVLGIRLATSRPHEFLSERSGLFRQRSSQASDEVAHIKSDEGLFWTSTWDERAALQARNRGRGGRGQWRGVGRGHEGYKHTSSPVLNQVLISKKDRYRVFSLTRPAYMQIYWNKRTRLHEKRVQLPEDWFGTPTWPPFHCFGTPIWPPWRHVKTLYWKARDLFVLKYRTGWRIWT